MSDYDPNYVHVKSYALVGQKAVIFNDKGQFLLLQRSGKAGGEGMWNFPGGAVETGEELISAIQREIKEEAGIDVFDLQLFAARSQMLEDNDFLIMLGYQAKYSGSEVILNWEHTACKWVTKNEASGMELTEITRYFISLL